LRLSIITPAKSLDDPKLKELIASIERQDFPKDEMEHLIITEGTSESAKAIGIRRAKGEVIGILSSDNELVEKKTLTILFDGAISDGASYPLYYHYSKNDDLLNRYFSLVGVNDPLALYMKKYDRLPQGDMWFLDTKADRTLGDNGFFVRKDLIEKTDLDNYYHIDNANEACRRPSVFGISLWHKTGGNIFTFFKKRYRYGLQHAFNKNRRWHLVDFRKPIDVWRFLCFIFLTLTVVPTLLLSIRGYLKIRDLAWFLHPIVCLMTVFTYGLLMVHLGLIKLYQLLSAPWTERTA